MSSQQNKRRFFIPEVVQTSGMDCGPASLKSIMDGLGVCANYGRLREACQTDVDGTSIDTIEVIANDLGMDAQQIMLPSDHLFIPSANVLPAMLVIQQPNLATHFIVVWRNVGPWVQIMDPASGRIWKRKTELLNEVYRHAMPVPAQAWRDWAGTDEFLLPLQSRMELLGLDKKAAQEFIKDAIADSSWKILACLDATVRMLQSLVEAKGVSRGKEANKLLASLLVQVCEKPEIIPDHFWRVKYIEGEDEESSLELRGAVALRVRNKQAQQVPEQQEAATQTESHETLARVLSEPQPSALKYLLNLVREQGLLLSLLMFALLISGFGLMFEALLLRGLIDIGQELGAVQQRLSAAGALLVFAFALLLIELPTTAGVQKLGRMLEARLRMAIYTKIPRLNDRYFQSRLTSDMAERAHSLDALKQAPLLAEQILRRAFGLVFTTCGIIWLAPNLAAWALLAMILAVAIPWLFLSAMEEKDMQVRTHEGALSRFYLDTLLGLSALRSHSAYKTVSLEHEGMLVEWMRAGFGMRFIVVVSEGLQLLAGFGLAAIILVNHFTHTTDSATVLLLTYWALYVPVLGQQLAQEFRQLPENKNRLLRLLEPLTAPDEPLPSNDEAAEQNNKTGKKIELRGVDVLVSGHRILNDIQLKIEAGTHIAIVGPSGAGKSSLVGLLLGWYRPIAGKIFIDDEEQNAQTLADLRTRMVWIDPGVQLWNKTLLANIQYGQSAGTQTDFASTIEESDLLDVLQRLPQGMQTLLGEGGKLISGGEGQRVRLARALNNSHAQLVILDEAFRGLERHRRVSLLKRLRQHWQHATFIHISHDVQDTLDFEQVLVIEQGRVAEHGSPSELLQKQDSRFSQLYKADLLLHEKLWCGAGWRRWRMQAGQVCERTEIRNKFEASISSTEVENDLAG